MNTPIRYRTNSRKALIAAAVSSFVLAGCAVAPVSPEGSADARAKLTTLQANPNLAGRAPVALKAAEVAVGVAEEPLLNDPALGAHRVYIADRKVEIAMAEASTRYAEEQRAKLGEERQRARLDARTREADKARRDADAARLAAADARLAAADATLQSDELQRQIDALHAEATDRGLVLTLGDVLFTTGKADLKAGATSNLDKLVAFLNQYATRTVEIEGFTDSVGSEDYNQGLSQRRADSVRTYLVQQGVGSERIRASGKGESQPVADNDSESGRQRNRRVEVIIENPPPVTPLTAR
jgi:outer membrane protein OmpA-like peptidoglycan-associated protein